MTSSGHPSPQRHPPGMAPPEAGAPGLSSQAVLDQLKKQFPRSPPHLRARLDSLYYLIQKVRQDLQEHHRQTEHFRRLLERCRLPQGFQPREADPDAWGPASPTAKPPEPSGLQGPDFADVMATRSSDWFQQPPGADGSSALQLDTLLSCDSEPQFWQDILTQQLWQILAGTPSRHRRPEQMPGLEPARRTCRLLKPICWDSEDFEVSWERPDALPWQPKKLAVPHRIKLVRTLRPGESVLAAAVSSFTRHVFTCGRNGVQVWSLAGQKAEDRFPVSQLRVEDSFAYLRTCLLFSNSTTLLTGGHNLAGVGVWDLTAPSLRVSDELPAPDLTCQALAANLEDSLAFASFTEGNIRIWDLRDHSVVRDLPGPPHGVKSIAVKDSNIWAGGLGACLRCWDLRTKEPREYQYESQIISLSPSPREDWVLVGTANGQQWLQSTLGDQRRMVGCKESTILGLKFSPLGQWWVSVGMDTLVSIYSMPTGTLQFQVPEKMSVMCCDVSPNNRLIATGTREHASVYQIMY
uniref:Transducin-like enhancer protein 6 n=1 Tax=Pipistrellus kuhlii TaxID=59472 RepID=A0A7J7TBD9_PIPKU|nr:TLE family member 6, subcortical maternal complex member [Pipistrellus kuhlii]